MSNYGPPGGSPHGHSPEPWSGAPDQERYGTPADPWGDADPSTAGNDQWGGQDRWGGQPASTPPDGGGASDGYPGAAGLGGYPSPPPMDYPVGPPTGYGAPGPGGGDPTRPYAEATARHENPPAGYPSPGAYPEPAGYPGAAPGGPVGPGQGWPATSTGPASGGGRTAVVVVLVTLAVLVLGSGGLAIYLLGQEPGGSGTQLTADSSEKPTLAEATGEPTDPTATPVQGEASTPPKPESSTDARFVTVGQCVVNEGDDDKPKLAISACAAGSYEVLKRFDGPTTGRDDAKEKCSQVEGYTDWYFFDSPLDVLDYVLCLKLR